MSADLVLEPQLRRGLPAVHRFVSAAVACDRPDVSALTAAGIPHYDALDLTRRLEQAGEMTVDKQWLPAARDGYRALLDTAAPPLDGPAKPRLQRLAEHERPREKAQRLGIRNLADAEVIALILRTGTSDQGVLELAQTLIDEAEGLLGLADRDVAELAQSHGLGPAKASELAAAFELGRRLATAQRRDRPVLDRPEAAAALVAAEMAHLGHEELWCLPLDPRSRLIGEPRVVSRGDIDGTDAGPRAFFRIALRAGAATAIAVHNHPTGAVEPSSADLAVTRALVRAGQTLDIHLVDHLIIGDGGKFTSIRRHTPACFGG